jgi:hypothetical protein
MKTFLFHNSQWMASKAEELPVKPTINSLFKEGTSLAAENRRYNQAIADLKDTALPVLNPEILKGVSLAATGNLVKLNYTYSSSETCPIVETSIPVLEWPGTAEKKKKVHVTALGAVMYKMFYELHLPKPDSGRYIPQIETDPEITAQALRNKLREANAQLERMAALREALKEMTYIAEFYHDKNITYTDMPFKNWNTEIKEAKKLLDEQP